MGPVAARRRCPTRRPRGTWSGSLWLTLFRLREPVDELRPAGVYGAAFVSYEEGSPLTYSELLVARPISTDKDGRRVTITDIWVDSPESVAGGRELWAIPKGLCDFSLESEHRGPLSTTEWTARLGRTPIASARFRDVSRAGLRLPFKGGTWQPGIEDTDGEDRTATLQGSSKALPGPRALGHQPRRPAGLARRRPAAGVVPPGGVPDVVRLIVRCRRALTDSRRAAEAEDRAGAATWSPGWPRSRWRCPRPTRRTPGPASAGGSGARPSRT